MGGGTTHRQAQAGTGGGASAGTGLARWWRGTSAGTLAGAGTAPRTARVGARQPAQVPLRAAQAPAGRQRKPDAGAAGSSAAANAGTARVGARRPAHHHHPNPVETAW